VDIGLPFGRENKYKLYIWEAPGINEVQRTRDKVKRSMKNITKLR
jgi:hypothetical protein